MVISLVEQPAFSWYIRIYKSRVSPSSQFCLALHRNDSDVAPCISAQACEFASAAYVRGNIRRCNLHEDVVVLSAPPSISESKVWSAEHGRFHVQVYPFSCLHTPVHPLPAKTRINHLHHNARSFSNLFRCQKWHFV